MIGGSGVPPVRAWLLIILLCLTSFAGCLSPIALERAVIQYDRKVQLIQSEILLLNIARAKQHLPGHFTTVSSIAATFDFQVNTGILGNINRGVDSALSLALGSSVSENPTISIIPIQGEEFAKRLLLPIKETKLQFIIQQGMDMAGILRLLGAAIVLEEDGRLVTLPNAPSQSEGYREFRRRVLHLSALNIANHLTVKPIAYEQPWPHSPDRRMDPLELTSALEHGYRWIVMEDEPSQVLSRRVVGRMLIANYDPMKLATDERRRLDRKATRFPPSTILIDIRPGFPGGDYPLHGWVKLRSFRTVMEFLGHGISDEPEFHVEKDPRTGPVPSNHPKILEIHETLDIPEDAAFAVPLNGLVYSISRDSTKDLEMFRMLYRLFQLTVTDVTKVPITPITIAK